MSEITRYLIQKTPIGTMMKQNPEGNWISAEDFDRVTAEQPAPVAVVLPERKCDRKLGQALMENYRSGWNACLDEVTRLNKKQD